MAKTHSSLTTSDLHQPKGFSVESTASMFVMSQSISTATASFHFLPNDTDTYTLGNTARAWKELYVSTGSIHFVEKDGTVARTLEVDATGFGFGGGDVSGSTISGSKLHIVGDTFIGGDLTLGDADSDSISIGADITSNLVPNADNNYDLGTSAKQWKDIYINGIGYIDQLGTDADPVAVYVNSGEVDGTVIGGESAAAGTFTTMTATTSNLGTLGANVDHSNYNSTNVDIDSGAIDGTAIGASSHTTIKGTTIDATTDFTVDGLVLSADTITNDAVLTVVSTGLTLNASLDIALSADGGNVTMDDGTTTIFDFNTDVPELKIMDDAQVANYASIAVGDNGATTFTTVDTDAAAANLLFTVDGTVDIDSAGLMTLDSGGAINLEPAAGSAVLIDGNASFDGDQLTGLASVTSTAFLGTIDGVVGGNTPAAITGTTIDATTDFTIDGLVITADNITNDAALEIQTAAGDIVLDPGGNNVLPGSDDADDLGASGTQWKDLYIDGVAYIDTLNADALGANLDHGNFNSTNVDIDSGAIDGTIIGANSAAAGTFGAIVGTSLNVSEGNITNVGDIALDTISADDGSSLSFSNNWTNAGRTVADLGIVTTVDINGGTIDGAIIGGASAGAITGTTIDATSDFTIGTTVITDDSIVMTPTSGDTATIAASTNGALTITTVDTAAAAANLLFTIDGTAEIASAGVITLDSGAAINIEPAAGSAILLDGTISIDAGVVTGATSVTSTAFLGTLDGVVGGNTAAAGTFTTMTATTSVLGALGGNVDHSNYNSTNVDIDSGAIDGTTIGAASAAAGTFTNLTVTTDVNIDDSSGDGAIDGVIIGAATSAAGTFTTLNTTGLTAFAGNVDLGNATSDTITATGTFDSDIVPSTDSARDLGTSVLQFAEAHIDTGYIDAITVTGTSTLTTVDINGGNIDGTVIGASSPASGSFSGIIVTGGMDVQGNLTTISSTNLDIGDRIVTLNASSAAGDGGLYINDADTTETGSLLWDVSADRWIGGLKDAEVTLVTISSTDTLTNKTLTTPTIVAAGWANANHTHAGSTTGGQITLGTGTTGNYVSTVVAGSGIDVSAATGDVTISIGTGEVVNAMIGDDEINSEHYAAGSIDNEHIADDAVNSEHYASESIDIEHIKASQIDSHHYVDGSIDRVHLAADIVDGTKIADDVIDSEHYVAASIDDEHLSHGVATGLAGAGTTATSGVINVIGGDGITANADDVDVTPAQTTITSVLNTGLKVGYDNNDCFNFATGSDGQISVYQNMIEEFQFTAGGTFHADADIVAYSSTVASDMNLKENITDTKYGLDDIMKLRGVDFDWKRKGRGRDVGVLAQEVEAVIPELVKEHDGLNGREKFKSVDYNKLVPVLIESIKELKKEIDDLKSN